MSRAWPANYAGVCGNCGKRFEVGTMVTRDSTGVVEEQCLDRGDNLLARPSQELRAMACTSCWMVHAPGQTEC